MSSLLSPLVDESIWCVEGSSVRVSCLRWMSPALISEFLVSFGICGASYVGRGCGSECVPSALCLRVFESVWECLSVFEVCRVWVWGVARLLWMCLAPIFEFLFMWGIYGASLVRCWFTVAVNVSTLFSVESVGRVKRLNVRISRFLWISPAQIFEFLVLLGVYSEVWLHCGRECGLSALWRVFDVLRVWMWRFMSWCECIRLQLLRSYVC